MADTAPAAVGQHHTPDLDAIRARADAATEGPWHKLGLTIRPGERRAPIDAGPSVATVGYAQPGSGCKWHAGTESDERRHADAEFIAHARADIPALLAEVDRLRAQPDAVVALADYFDSLALNGFADRLRRALGEATP